jgi:hypothetical protein
VETSCFGEAINTAGIVVEGVEVDVEEEGAGVVATYSSSDAGTYGRNIGVTL